MHGAIPPLPQYAFMEWCAVKAQGQLYLFTLLYLLPNKQSCYKQDNRCKNTCYSFCFYEDRALAMKKECVGRWGEA